MRQKTGFSLMELIVVVVILSILVSIGLINYIDRKKRSDYQSATVQVSSIAAAEKNYYLGAEVYASTASTATTNNVLGTFVQDGSFKNYSVVDVTSGGFNISVINSGATYKFNSNATRLSCTGTGCLT